MSHQDNPSVRKWHHNSRTLTIVSFIGGLMPLIVVAMVTLLNGGGFSGKTVLFLLLPVIPGYICGWYFMPEDQYEPTDEE